MDSSASSINLADQLAACVRDLAATGYCPATGGNFSIRVDETSLWMTASGVDKRRLQSSDLIRMGLDGVPLGYGRPSAETELHLWIYRNIPNAGAVLHVHSRPNTVLSRQAQHSVEFSGFEMQKAITGNTTHERILTLPVVDNSQKMGDICRDLDVIRGESLTFGFLVRGHGLYAWGEDLPEARRHLEGWEFLLECKLEELKISSNFTEKD